VKRLPKLWLTVALFAAFAGLHVPALAAQDDPSDEPLGDVARNLRKKTPPSQDVIDNDNFSQVMDQVESNRASGSALKILMAGESKGFQVSAPDVTCSLSFTANTKVLLSSQYAQMDLPPSDILKLVGPATIEGDALQVTLFNGTDWHVSEVGVALTIVKKAEARDTALFYGTAKLVPAVAGTLAQQSEVRPEKKPDFTVLYRMRAAAPPFATTVFSAPLNTVLTPDQEWHWAIVQAKGYPPQIHGETAPQNAQVTDPPPAEPQLPTAPGIPQSLSADPTWQAPQ